MKSCKSKNAPGGDIRFQIGVPIPIEGTAFKYVMASEFAIEFIGRAVMTLKED